MQRSLLFNSAATWVSAHASKNCRSTWVGAEFRFFVRVTSCHQGSGMNERFTAGTASFESSSSIEIGNISARLFL